VDGTFLQERIDKIKALIVVYEDALTALITGGAQSYTIDTGQTRQTVTKFDAPALRTTLEGLYNQLATLQARSTGSGVVHVSPGW